MNAAPAHAPASSLCGDTLMPGRYPILTFALLLIMIHARLSAQTSVAGDAVENVGQGSINWTAGEVYATGIGVPPASAANAAQSRAMAVRAAQVVAYRNLLEIVKGVRVDSETVVQDFITRSDVIRTRVDGIVKGARIVRSQHLSDGSVEVIVAMPMKGALMDAVIPTSFGATSYALPTPSPASTKLPAAETKTAPLPARPGTFSPQADTGRGAEKPRTEPPTQEPDKPAPPAVPPQQEKKPDKPKTELPPPAPASGAADSASLQFKGGKATGVVIDGRGLGLRPALLPKIVDVRGQEIYVGQVVTRTNAVEQGVAGYAKDVQAAANNFRVTDNPAVIKGIQASGTTKTDVVLGQADAQMLRDLSKQGDFLQYCRVIIVY